MEDAAGNYACILISATPCKLNPRRCASASVTLAIEMCSGFGRAGSCLIYGGVYGVP